MKAFQTRIRWLLVLALLQSGTLMAQVVQYGRVTELNSRGKMLSGVSVSVPSAHDCQPTASDAHGLFRMSFSEHETGDIVVGLHVSKYGYEVVNIHILREGWVLTPRDTLKVVLAPEGKLEEARLKYYGLLETACIRRYDSTLSLLNGQLALQQISQEEYKYWKDQAQDELLRSYRNLDEFADMFARTNADDTDEFSVRLCERLHEEDMLGALALVSPDYQTSVAEAYQNGSLFLPQMQVVQETASSEVYENDLLTKGAKYANTCLYLGAWYKMQGNPEQAITYLNKALKMFEMLNGLGNNDFTIQIEKTKEILRR